MKIIARNVPGHFIDAQRCRFWLHKDICHDEEDAYSKALFCISLIGEYGSPGEWCSLNASGKTYEIAVFDKTSENPWAELETFTTSDKKKAIKKHAELVVKYKKIAEKRETLI